MNPVDDNKLVGKVRCSNVHVFEDNESKLMQLVDTNDIDSMNYGLSASASTF